MIDTLHYTLVPLHRTNTHTCVSTHAHPINAGSRAGPSAGNTALKKQLLDHVLSYYPAAAVGSSAAGGAGDAATVEQYALFFDDLMRRTVELVARWQVTCIPFIRSKHF